MLVAATKIRGMAISASYPLATPDLSKSSYDKSRLSFLQSSINPLYLTSADKGEGRIL